MAVYRVIKDKNNPYVLKNTFYDFDSRLSLKAKGLMGIFLSRPDDWNFYHKEILKHCKDGKDSLNSAINELIKTGYIKRELSRDTEGKLLGGYDYTVFEVPDINLKNTECGKTEIGENRNRRKPFSENPPLLNTELLLNNEVLLNNKTSTSTGTDLKSLFEGNICMLKKTTEAQFNKYLQRYDYNFVKSVILYCIRCKAKSFKYFKKTIDDSIKLQIDTAPKFINHVQNFMDKKYSQTKSNKVDSFNNFEQRKYDFDELEKDLLGWRFNDEGMKE